MKINYVIDTSVAFKWFDETESGRKIALNILRQHKNKSALLIVPDLIIYELANAWATKSHLSAEDIEANLEMLAKTQLKIIQINFSLATEAVRFSKKFKVSVYDAIYAVLAKSNNCDLITADEKFATKVNLKFIKSLPSLIL